MLQSLGFTHEFGDRLEQARVDVLLCVLLLRIADESFGLCQRHFALHLTAAAIALPRHPQIHTLGEQEEAQRAEHDVRHEAADFRRHGSAR